MTKLKIGIVEDEVIIADHIASILLKLGYEVAEIAVSYTEALQMIEEEKPDLLLLDIQLRGKKDGIDLAVKIKESYALPIIFLTANSDTATVDRAKKVNPGSYIVKPFTKDGIYTAIEICIYNFSESRHEKPLGEDNNFIVNNAIFIREGQVYNKVNFSDILYLESEHVYIRVHTIEKTFLVRSSLQDYFEHFDGQKFFRIHRSYIVNLNHIQGVNSEYIIINNITLPLSKSSREQLLSRLKLG